MGLVLYNTRTRREEPFEPLEPGKVSLYVCGITVYDRCHVGHARSLVFFDTLVRYLRWRGFEVRFVRNITDVDDKIINRALENGEDFRELTARYIEAMHRDVAALGCLPPDIEPQATDHIGDMVDLIAALEEKGIAYRVGDGDVYFSVEAFKPYGALSHRCLEDMMAGARVDIDERKKSPMDFALWKAVKPGEPAWPSPWGEGRPGWHLECSAMSMRYLGRLFDIHGGGEDLIFPHHENELAQSAGAFDTDFVRYWVHHAFVRIDQEKMSKSLGNAFAIEDVLREVEAEGLRLHLLSTHYRSPLDFSPTGIAESTKALVRAYETLARVAEAGAEIPQYDFESAGARPFLEAMDADLNTARAVGVIFEAVREANRALDAGDIARAAEAAGLIGSAGKGLGLLMRVPSEFLGEYNARAASAAGLSAQQIEGLIGERAAARARRDFGRADEIRAELLAQGIVLEDGAGGTTWRRG
ncbi:MAG TPA: cysteine--tRNA ligase [Candidatus Limnocylindrales bacterium]|nr:cysteine--tRNA ligase [Candidatus Limnocylindrales bacterium]